MRKVLIFLFLLANTSSHAQQQLKNSDLEELKNRMEGTFDSKEQSDVDKGYYNISLHIKQIWETKKNKNGYWLYVEQALADNEYKPYRQRIYHIYKKDNETLVTEVYEMNNPDRFIGAWNETSIFKKFSRDSLINREGCALYLKKDENGNFYGETSGKDCPSSLKGASYTTSEVLITPNMMMIWDRGWNNRNVQVWGADKGGYKFRKFTLLRSSKE